MPSHFVSRSSSSAIPSRGSSKIQKKISSAECVKKFTEYLVLGKNQNHALQGLYQCNCPIRVFEDCLTENVLEKYYSNRYEYQYQVNLLTEKFADLRRRELRDAQEKLWKKGELTASVSFKKEFMDIQMKQIESRDQKMNNQLFAEAFKSTEVFGISKKATTKPDYSKYKITKRSNRSSASVSSTSSSSSGNGSPCSN